MPLKIRVKPEGKIFVGDVKLKNVGNRPCELLILTQHKVLREEWADKGPDIETTEDVWNRACELVRSQICDLLFEEEEYGIAKDLRDFQLPVYHSRYAKEHRDVQ